MNVLSKCHVTVAFGHHTANYLRLCSLIDDLVMWVVYNNLSISFVSLWLSVISAKFCFQIKSNQFGFTNWIRRFNVDLLIMVRISFHHMKSCIVYETKLLLIYILFNYNVLSIAQFLRWARYTLWIILLYIWIKFISITKLLI